MEIGITSRALRAAVVLVALYAGDARHVTAELKQHIVYLTAAASEAVKLQSL